MDIETLEDIISQNTGVMVYFSGEDCGVCHALRPKIEELLNSKFPFIKQVFLDTKEHLEIASWLGIFSVPTLVVFIEQREFIREGRNMSLYELESKLQRIVGLLS